ncbi:MAG: hypothetical protein RLZZ123_1129 [Pseudomonadota bacterium]
MSSRTRCLQLTFFVQAHHRKPKQFRRFGLRNVVLRQGSVYQLIENSGTFLRQWVSRLVFAPPFGGKAFLQHQVHCLGDHATLTGRRKPRGFQ